MFVHTERRFFVSAFVVGIVVRVVVIGVVLDGRVELKITELENDGPLKAWLNSSPDLRIQKFYHKLCSAGGLATHKPGTK